MNLRDKKFGGLKIALTIMLKRTFQIGDQVGFTIGRKHYIIKRDKLK